MNTDMNRCDTSPLLAYHEALAQLIDSVAPRGDTIVDKPLLQALGAVLAQSIEAHIDVFAPGGYGQIHGHMNSAVFFVLKGKGHDIHDGRRVDWEAGDALIVENCCVHQHLNDDLEGESIVLVMKAKPLFLFMHMIFQKMVQYPPTDPAPGQENYRPPENL